MHWGHAVSKDLVHWEELGDKLLPDDMGPMFSGSAVVDWQNSSGFGKGGKPPMVLFYTAAGMPTVQCIAYSTDGRTFTKYAGNPVLQQITAGNRDPKVIWHEATKRWIMVLYVELDGVHTIHFFTSPNIKDWTFTSKTEGFFECPDFFELTVDGDPQRKKSVLLGASSEYRIGLFDGTKFLPETPKLPGHRGKGFYAAQSFSDVPNGRRILIGWFQTESKGMPFNQSMTVPLELRLMQTDDGPRITYTPVKELDVLRSKAHHFDSMTLRSAQKNPLDDIRAELVELQMEFEPIENAEIVFNVRDVLVSYDSKKQELSVAGHRASAPLRNGKQRLAILCDRTGVEVFASDGLCYVPMPVNMNPANLRISLEARSGAALIDSLSVYELRSAWRLNN
jgi:sucrose-6-phosphate hydrolase SacC (GH32 family)